ncbi:single-stranded DNA-binding protein [Microcella alkaliphila]|jgi:single-strand DNA-binding protein|uniref:Single-stranded DNA-binding protein n=1 Tax=Microcella alkaliphila TaxID=279828 RepID=A0A0U5BPG8_9MICO|nr:single-stranded DNA-binding protein [Microcella alkaliphila]BAU32763.1 single-stranded DNA-binding protein [Microcella alkaliphila]
MTDTITVTGLVATEPRHITTQNGLTITSFRLASNQRRFDRSQNAWIDGDTNWYTVTAFRQLGMHVASSVRKGERVVVAGRVRQRDWQSDTNKGTTIEIDADTVGHDLTFGRSTFTRTVKAASTTSAEGEGAPAAVQPTGAETQSAPEPVAAETEAVAPF